MFSACGCAEGQGCEYEPGDDVWGLVCRGKEGRRGRGATAEVGTYVDSEVVWLQVTVEDAALVEEGHALEHLAPT